MEIEIYADEIITPKDFNNSTRNFIGIGCLFVPVSKKQNILSNLINSRCLFESNESWFWEPDQCPSSITNGGKCKNQWHQQNMCEIHHTELRNSRSSNSQREISKKWLNYLIENNIRDRKEIYFNILFVDLDTLQIENFGTQKVHENIYNKFFRTVIHYGVKSFFGNKTVTIKKVFHDKGSMENHGYFPYLNLMKLDLGLGKYGLIEDKEIAFIDSDHRNYLRESNDLLEESHLIQLIDLLIGSITQNIYYLSDDRLKKELAMIVRPLVNRLLESPSNPNSSYNYYQRQHIGFFPKYSLENATYFLDSLSHEQFENYKKGNIYTNRKMEMPSYDPKQTNLSLW